MGQQKYICYCGHADFRHDNALTEDGSAACKVAECACMGYREVEGGSDD